MFFPVHRFFTSVVDNSYQAGSGPFGSAAGPQRHRI